MMRLCKTLPCLLLLALPLLGQGFGANGIKKGEWRTKDVPDGWYVMKAGRYVFQSNAPRDRVKEVALHLNAAYKLYERTFPTGRTPRKPFIVKIFKNGKEFRDYGAPPGAGAYYSWHDNEMVGYDTGKLDGEMTTGTTGEKNDVLDKLRARHTMDTLGVFAHEGWHQYFHFICASKVSFPSWCDEGIGEYFYSMRCRDGEYELGAPNDYRLGTIRSAIEHNRHIPLEQLVTYDQRKYYSVAGLAYAEGWSFVHFLLEHPDYAKKRYLQNYMNTFIAQHSIEEAVERVFARMDWEQTEKDWKEWVMKLPYEDPEAAATEAAAGGLEQLEELIKKAKERAEKEGDKPAGGKEDPDGKDPDGR